MRHLVIGLALVSASAAARDLPVPPDKGWKHAATGVVLTARLAGMHRTALTDATDSESDVTAQFETDDGSVFATVFLFRPAVADVGVWFDRARTALEAGDRFRDAAPATVDPLSFATGGAPATSSLRQVYAMAGGPYRSTGLAVMPVGDWIITLRMSAKAGTAAELDAQMLRTIAAMHWPTPAGLAVTPAAPVKACATPLVFGKAKQVKADGGDLLSSLLMGSLTSKVRAENKEAAEPHPTWCRNGEGRVEYAAYRSSLDTSGYTLALFDSGRAVNVFPSLMAQIEKTGVYSVTLEDVDGTSYAYPSFSSLPSPEQVWKLLERGERIGAAKEGKITLSPKAL
jgi:hypothetical protein